MTWRKAVWSLGATIAAGWAMTTAPVLAQDAKDTLRVAMHSKAPSRGDIYTIFYIFPSMYWWEGIFDSFVRIDDKAQILPFAAEKWEVMNPTTWRVTFRKDVEFTSGRKNDAANVVKIFDYLHTTEAGKASGIMRNMKLASYRAVDSHTVEFVTPEPDPLLVAKFAAFYVADMVAFNDMGRANYGAKPVTSGPYKVVNWTDQEMQATVYEKSWRPAKIKNLYIVEVPEPASRLAAIVSGQTDMAHNLAPEDVARIKASGHTAAVEGAPFVDAVALFTKDFANKWSGKAPFSDRRVRQAANYALNRDSLAQNLFKGLARPAGQPAIPSTNGYNPSVLPYPYDPAKAKQLLTEAGYPNGFSVTMETAVGLLGGRELLQVVSEDLGKVGIKTEVVVVPFAERARLFNQQKWNGDLTSFAMFHSPVMDAAIPFSVYDGCRLPIGMVCIPALNELLAAQEKEMDPAKRRALLQELMKRSSEEALALYTFEGLDVTGISKRVRGYKNWNKVIHYESMTLEN
ncbi:MAG: hypothetical protein FJX65_06955 [Alphaproteobacteria bacterium]|nr:hypothetical protein [Alphaproteobacteria bacterium]